MRPYCCLPFSVVFLLGLALAAPAAPLSVYAAASLSAVLEELAPRFDGEVRFSFAGTSTLAKQIDAGAPADVILAANANWMDYLEERGRIDTATRVDLLGNALALVAPKDETFGVEIRPSFDLAAAFGGRLALADPAHVPAGIYARQALQKLGWWENMRGRLAPAPHVRAALVFVERGECAAGIVYATDAVASNKVEVLALLPDSLHARIIYPIAAVKGGRQTEAQRFIDLLRGQPAATVFARHGFVVLAFQDSVRAEP
jgi:molybdate transport system substrate-binding protein